MIIDVALLRTGLWEDVLISLQLSDSKGRGKERKVNKKTVGSETRTFPRQALEIDDSASSDRIWHENNHLRRLSKKLDNALVLVRKLGRWKRIQIARNRGTGEWKIELDRLAFLPFALRFVKFIPTEWTSKDSEEFPNRCHSFPLRQNYKPEEEIVE